MGLGGVIIKLKAVAKSSKNAKIKGMYKITYELPSIPFLPKGYYWANKKIPYIGLNDKNNLEIYEHDIVKMDKKHKNKFKRIVYDDLSENEIEKNKDYIIGEIYYEKESQLGIKNNEAKYIFVSEKINGNELEIIGDSFENPEAANMNYANWICPHCKKQRTELGYDGCIGYIEGVIEACCGHDFKYPYVIFKNGYRMEFENVASMKEYFKLN